MPDELAPVTDERLKQIQTMMEAGYPACLNYEELDYRYAVRELLASERYWRNAVKNIDAIVRHPAQGGDLYSCAVCGALYVSEDGKRGHKKGCAWKEANK